MLVRVKLHLILLMLLAGRTDCTADSTDTAAAGTGAADGAAVARPVPLELLLFLRESPFSYSAPSLQAVGLGGGKLSR
ncbi:hypothetical protein NDU88_005354 [Pleurodeles waltl]|uniref:Secreted protein n=1 Tax=Pleurodeles waltl TaxID=8319 RepID=A0AAV7TCD3_PLEWA|nr:hypothetical protein NDU88_005354 [Pleurodeles waltl]